MKIKQTVKSLLVMVALAFVAIPVMSSPVYAVGDNGCETPTALIKCDNVQDNATSVENTGVWSLLLTAINILTAGIGILAVAGIVYGSVLYASAGGSPEQVKKAMGIISNVVIGIVAYALMYALLNFLIPGGLFD